MLWTPGHHRGSSLQQRGGEAVIAKREAELLAPAALGDLTIRTTD